MNYDYCLFCCSTEQRAPKHVIELIHLSIYHFARLINVTGSVSSSVNFAA